MQLLTLLLALLKRLQQILSRLLRRNLKVKRMWVVRPITFNGFEFERASVANYYDEDGKLTEAAVDVLRLGYDPETLDYIGPIFEEEATNLIPYSNDFIEWTAANASTGIGILIPEPTPDDGAGESQFMDSLGADDWGISLNMGTSLSGDHTFSVYAKEKTPGTGGASTFTLRINGGAGFSASVKFSIEPDNEGIVSTSGPVAYTNIKKIEFSNHYRCAFSVSIPGAALPYYAHILGDNAAGTGTNGNGFHFLWGAQLEAGEEETSFIYTDGTAEARAADVQSTAPPTMVDSNIPEDDADEWDAGEDYDPDDLVMVLGNVHRVFRALASSTSGDPKYPPDNPTYWVDLGATNRWRAFDMDVGSDLQSSNTDLVEYTLSLDETITHIALFNLIGTSAKVTMFYGEEIVYEEEVELIAPPSESEWWNYWFDRRAQIKDVVFSGFPPASPTSVLVQVFGEGNTAVGKLVAGYAFYAGFAEYGTTGIGITSFSTKERDAFGNYFIQSRRFVGNMNVKTVVDVGNEVFLKDALAELRDIPSAYIVETDSYPILILGFFKDFQILFSTPASSYCSTDIEGI
jgi:hypothetical protein